MSSAERLRELTGKIDAHLKRMAADPRNLARPFGQRTFSNAWAWAAGRYVAVVYRAFGRDQFLHPPEAELYLRLLDDGFEGTFDDVKAANEALQ